MDVSAAVKPIKEKPKRKEKRTSSLNYNKWGLYFIAPFFIVYFVFSLIPLLTTFYYSFFEYFKDAGLNVWIGPTFNGFGNYVKVFAEGSEKLFKYFGNTMIMWILGFIPQLIVSLLLALWFSSNRLHIKGQKFFKTTIYMPNIVMASAFAALFFRLFTTHGPMEMLFGIEFSSSVWWSRGIIALINFLMWFGNTTILLMAGIMGIDQKLIESAQVDGANSVQVFTKIILPLLKPILLFVLITSLIGGVQMFDIPQIYSNGDGGPNFGTMTIMMYLAKLLGPSKQFGLAGAVSVMVFIFTALISLVFFSLFKSDWMDEQRSMKKVKKS